MPTETLEVSKTAEETAIRGVLDDIAEAVRSRDVERFLAHCAPEIASFDLLPPLKHVGADAIRQTWKTALGEFQGRAEYEIHQLEIAVGDDVAFCRSLNRFGGTFQDGKRAVNWLCSTLGWRKVDGEWKIAHQHVSVPFDMKTDKALLDLEP